jgi:histone-lysine N-methyltransferase SETMAR
VRRYQGEEGRNVEPWSCLHHDKAPVHTAAIAKAAVKECGFEEIEHPPYSRDLAPSDYYLFSKLKKDLRDKKFDNDE